MSVRRCVPIILLALLWLAAFSAAAAPTPVSATLDARGPVRFDGEVRALASDATLLLEPPGQGEVLTLRAPEGALRIVRVVREAVDNPLSGDAWLAPEHTTDSFVLRDAVVTVRDADAHFLGVLAPTGDGVLSLAMPQGAHALADEADGKDLVIGWTADQPYAYYYTRAVPAHSFRFAYGGGADLGVRGQLQLALHGATLDVTTTEGTRTFRLGEWDTTTNTLARQRATYRHESAFAVLSLQGPTVALAPGTQAAFYSRAPTLALHGRIVLEDAAGAVQAGDAKAQPRGTTVELAGDLTVTVTRAAGEPDMLGARGERTTVRVQGQGTHAWVGGRELLSVPLPAETAAPLAGLAALAVAWFSGAGPKLVGMAVTPLYAGVAPRSLLENDRRRAIYQAVLDNPGVHMRELQRMTRLRWGSLQYHTAVLLGMGLLHAAQAGRRTLLACDVHGLAAEQIRALHLLRGDRARRVADAVAASRSVTQRDVVLAAGVSPRLASRYLSLMAQLGLVETYPGRPKRYVGTSRMAELLPRMSSSGSPAAALPPAR